MIRCLGPTPQRRLLSGIRRMMASAFGSIFWSLIVISAATGLDGSQTEQVDSDLENRLQLLINQLGSDEFEVREQAESGLLNAGPAAIDVVRKARLSGNSEVRFRAERLLPALKRAEAESRIKDFVDTGRAEPAETFAAWREFSKIVGKDKAARKLYASIHKATPEIFDNLWNSPSIARAKYFQLVNSLNRAQFRSLNSAAVMFLDTIEFENGQRQDRTEGQFNRIWTSTETLIRTGEYLSRPNAVSFIRTSGFENEFRLLIDNWIKNLPSDDNHLLATRLSLIETHRLMAWLPQMVELASNENASVPNRARAISIIAKLGGPNEIEILEKLLNASEVVGHFATNRVDNKLLEVQLRDVALAACVHLSGQALEDYGFNVHPHRKNELISISRAGFFRQSERNFAFTKWIQYHQEHLRNDDN